VLRIPKKCVIFLHTLDIPETYRFVSFDVVNLFGSVPAEEAVKMVIQRLEVDQTLSERTSLSVDSLSVLLFFCVRSNFFRCDGRFFRTSSCPMGSPLSPTLASVFMENLEGDVLSTTQAPVMCWKRYVDDTFVVIKTGCEDQLLNELNGYHEHIRFTSEREKDGVIAFLDIKVERVGSKVKTTVFRKESSSDRYIDYTSSHYGSIKWGVVSCLRRRAEAICRQDEDLLQEISYLKGVFKKNGFPERTLAKKLKLKNSLIEPTPKQNPQKHLIIPYVPGVSEKIKSIAHQYDIGVFFKRGRSIGSVLDNTKLDKMDSLSRGGVVYMQPCNDCTKVYVGETGRKAMVRKKEHEKDVKELNMRSAIAEHCHTLGHKIDFEKFSVVGSERGWLRRRIKEGVTIMRYETMNRDEGLRIDKRWKPFLA
jgi:hypothetical protein